MSQWTRPVAVVLAWALSLSQLTPAAYAMRPEGAGQSGVTGEKIREDGAWVWGAPGANLTELGRANLVRMGKEIVSAAFAEGRAFPLIGPGSRSTDDLVADYARRHEARTGRALSDAQKGALKERLARAQGQLSHVVNAIMVSPNLPGVESIQASEIGRFVLVLDEPGTPALVTEGIRGTPTHQALVAYSGQHAFQGWQEAVTGLGQQVRNVLGPKSVYLSLEQIEGLIAEGPTGHDALVFLLRHEVNDAIRGFHLDEPSSVAEAVNGAIARVFEKSQAAQQAQAASNEAHRAEQIAARKTAARKNAEKLAKRVQLVPYLISLGRFFEGGRVPEYVVKNIETRLAQAAQAGTIKDALVRRFGSHVLLEVHSNGPQRNPEVDRLVVDLVSDVVVDLTPSGERPRLTKAFEELWTREAEFIDGFRTPGTKLTPRPYAERAKALRIRTGEFAFNERGAEPIYVSAALGGGPAAFNWVIMRLLNEAIENQLKIEGIREDELKVLRAEYEKYRTAKEQGDEALAQDLEFNAANLAYEAEQEGPGYIVVVERIADILAGKTDRTAYRFVFPRSAPYIHTLVDDQTEWVITKVLPRPGSRLYDVTKAPEDQDPMLNVMVDQVGDATQDGESFSPIFVAKQQSGAPAIGEFVSATTQFYLTTSGPREGTVHRGVIPVTLEEADAGTFADDGLVQMVSYTYQSYDNGRIPHSEVHDQVAISTDVQTTREDERFVHDSLMLLGSFQPAVTAPEATRRAEHTVEAMGPRYHEIPAVTERDTEGKTVVGADGKPIVRIDPILKASNASQVVTVSDLKADIGATGHQLPYKIYRAAFIASLKVAVKQGLIDGFDVAAAGDDNHFILFHKRGVDNAEIHGLAWATFFRAGWVSQRLKYKLYGFMQDLVDPKVVELIKAGKLDVYANLNDDFIKALAEEIQSLPEEAARMGEIRRGYENFKQGKSSGKIVELLLPGNVRGMGIGFAEKTLSAGELGRFPRWSVIANDKGAAGAFNYPAYWATRLSLLLRQAFPGGIPDLAGLSTSLDEEVAKRMPDVPEENRKKFVRDLVDEVWSKHGSDLQHTRELERFLEMIQHGLVFETWDVLPNSRAFIDAETEDAQLLSLLSAANDHNIKRIWTKKRAGWISDLTPEEVAAIDARVEGELSALRPEYEQRKTYLQEEVAAWQADHKKGRSPELLNPWERAILNDPLDTVLEQVRPRLVELYKVAEFLGGDYIASVSTEKLAAVTGGEYVGKDDSVMIAIDPFASLHRAITRVAVRVNIGNARGSHYVAMRPEGRDTAVAVKWSNPIEISIRYAVAQDGTVKADASTGLAVGEDMYAGAAFDAARERVVRFNEMWINSQGGFTPHGPNIDRDIEAAYPARKTRNKIVAKDSPFAVAVSDTTVAAVEQGRLVEQFPDATDYTISPEVAEQAADLANPRWIVVHSSVYAQGPDAAIAQELIQRQLRQVLGNGSKAIHFALVVDGASTPDEAQRKAEALAKAIPSASNGAAKFDLGMFDLVLPAQQQPGELLGLLSAGVAGSIVGSVIGPSAWAQAIKEASPKPEEVAAVAVEPAKETGQIASAAPAIVAGVEAAAAGGKLNPKLAAQLKLLQEGDLVVPQNLDIKPETEAEVRSYQTTIAAATSGV